MLRFALVALSSQCGLGAAQNYPAGPLRVIVPYPPGGGTDILSRAIALKLNEAWGQPVVVENRGGANGNIGTAMAARANPDGHTIAEAGVPGYAMINWYGMLVPAATSKPVLSKLHAETVRILKLPEIKDRLAAEGATVIGSTPEQFAAFLKDEIAKAARIVRAAGMTASN